MLRTLGLGFLVTAITLILGYPLALLIVRSPPRRKTLLMAIALSPLLINLVVRTYAWLVLLGENGIVNGALKALGLISSPLPISGNFVSVTIGLIHITLPLMVLSLVAVAREHRPPARRSRGEPGRHVVAGDAQDHAAAVAAGHRLGIAAGVLLHDQRVRHAGAARRQPRVDRQHDDLPEVHVLGELAGRRHAGGFILLLMNFAVIWLHSRVFREERGHV
jgi:putative spermidine/putrescine transport system permease protein